MVKHTISVVIPLYNKAPYIQRALDSVLAQSMQSFEVIVVDDGSTDGGGHIVKANVDPRIRLIEQKNAGVSVARNRGIAEAQAELIAFLDADDAWKPAFLATIQKLHQAFPEAGMYATAYEIGRMDGIRTRPNFFNMPNEPWEGIIPNYFKASWGEPPISASSVAIPKKTFATVGNFPVGVHRGEDLDMWLRAALKYPVAFSSQSQAVYFQDTNHRSGTLHPVKAALQMVQTAEHALAEGHAPLHLQNDVKEYIAKYQIQTASECVLTGNTVVARKLLMTCYQTRQFRLWWLWWCFWAALPYVLFKPLWRLRTLFSMASLL